MLRVSGNYVNIFVLFPAVLIVYGYAARQMKMDVCLKWTIFTWHQEAVTQGFGTRGFSYRGLSARGLGDASALVLLLCCIAF